MNSRGFEDARLLLPYTYNCEYNSAQQVEIEQVILLDDQLSTVQLVVALVVPAIVRDSLQAHAF